MARIDSLGNVLWQRTYGQLYSNLSTITALDDGSYALAGYQLRVPAGQQFVGDGWLLRIDLDGRELRSLRTGQGTQTYSWYDLRALPNGGVLVVGSHVPISYSGQPNQGVLARFDSLNQSLGMHYVTAAQPSGTYGVELHRLELLQGNDFLVQGYRY